MRKPVRLVAIALSAVMALSLAGCGDKDVAAKVNGEVVTLSEIDRQMEQVKQQYATMFEGPDGEARMLDFRQRLLEQAIDRVLVLQAAKDEGVEVTDGDIDKEIESLKAGFANDEAFEQALEKSNVDLETLRDQLRDQLVTKKLVDQLTGEIKVSDADIEKYYNDNKAQFMEQAAVHAAHILFAEDDKATAEKVLAEIKGGGDFAELAKEHSKDTVSAANGGDLGWPTTPYVQEFQAACDEMKPGETSELVKSPFGWHIIKVIEKRDDRQKSLSEVKETVSQMLSQQTQAEAYRQYVDELKKSAKIEILDPQLKGKMQVQVDGEDAAGDNASETPAEGEGE